MNDAYWAMALSNGSLNIENVSSQGPYFPVFQKLKKKNIVKTASSLIFRSKGYLTSV